MNPKKVLTLVLALILVTAPLMAFNPLAHAAPPMSCDVTNSGIANINTTDPYHILQISNASTVGATFTIEVHLLHANVVNAPSGVLGAEVHFDFSALVSGGSPQFTLTNVVDDSANLLGAGALYGIPFAVYLPDSVTKAPGPSYTGGTQIIFAGAGAGSPYNGEDVTLFTLTFKVNGPWPNTLVSPLGDPVFPLTLTMAAFADPSANPINCNVNNGAVQLQRVTFAFPVVPNVSIGPSTITGALTVGQPVTYTVSITSDPFWDIAGYDVIVAWDPTLLTYSTYTQGTFLTMNGDPIFDFNFTTASSVEVVATKLSDIAPSGGSGTLFSLTLLNTNVSTTYPPPSGTVSITYSDLVSWAHPELGVAPWFNAITAVDVPYAIGGAAGTHTRGPSSAAYVEGFLPQGAAIDLYDQYPAPYGGQGAYQHSDSFAPQALVNLYAKVTYAQDRVSNKLVTFQVNNALGQKVTILQNYTDINGIAWVQYRIPMSDYLIGGNGTGTWDPAIFGTWTVTATVEVDQLTFNDSMSFAVGWLVQVMSVTSNSASYLKYAGLPMNFTVDVRTIHEQPLSVLVSVDTYDTQGYPIGETSWYVTVQATRNDTSNSMNPVDYIYGPTGYSGLYYGWGLIPYGPYLVHMASGTFVTQYIPTWARVGTATVVGYALTDYPVLGGTPYGPQSNADGTTTSFQILLH